MKKFGLLMIMVLGIACSMTAQTDSDPNVENVVEVVQGPNMIFEKTVVDYGTIEKGSDPYRVFSFANKGTEPLIIKHAKGSCGCTVPEYAKAPVGPGESSEIKVRYDTQRVGPFTKTVTITTNELDDDGNNVKRVLQIKGVVNKPAAETPAVPTNNGGIGGGN